jgi:GxxExxY protein
VLHQDITDKVLKAFYTVNNTLGYGFLERVYENAMTIELMELGCKVIKQKSIKVYYKNREIGEYYADLIVDDMVIIELKAVEKITKEHESQLINYLKSTNIEVGLLVNFGKRPEFKRKIFANHRKRTLASN